MIFYLKMKIRIAKIYHKKEKQGKRKKQVNCYAFLIQKNGLWSRREYIDIKGKNPLFRTTNLGTIICKEDLKGFTPVSDTRYVLKDIKSVLEENIKKSSHESGEKLPYYMEIIISQPYTNLLNWTDEAERVLLGRTI